MNLRTSIYIVIFSASILLAMVYAPILIIAVIMFILVLDDSEQFNLPDRPDKVVDKSIEPTTYHFGNMYMSRKDKKAYMKSAQWQTKRKQVFERDNHQCQSCGSTEALNCHHQSYMHLGDEPLEHLITLCTDCHSALHAQRGYTRKGNYFI